MMTKCNVRLMQSSIVESNTSNEIDLAKMTIRRLTFHPLTHLTPTPPYQISCNSTRCFLSETSESSWVISVMFEVSCKWVVRTREFCVIFFSATYKFLLSVSLLLLCSSFFKQGTKIIRFRSHICTCFLV